MVHDILKNFLFERSGYYDSAVKNSFINDHNVFLVNMHNHLLSCGIAEMTSHMVTYCNLWLCLEKINKV